MSNNSGNYDSKYRDIIKMFTDNGKRLFVVDCVKYRAITGCVTVLSYQRPDTFLCVTRNGSMARELAGVFKTTVKTPYIIDSLAAVENFVEAAKSKGLSENNVNRRLATDALIKQFPQVFVVLNDDDGNAIFNKPIFKDKSINGYCPAGCSVTGDILTYGDYCLSDLLADTKYKFIFVDEIYDLFGLTNASNDDYVKNENIYFADHRYSSPEAMSLRRLRNLVAGAEMQFIYSSSLTGNAMEKAGIVQNILRYKEALTVKNKFLAEVGYEEYLAKCESIDGALRMTAMDESVVNTLFTYLSNRFGSIDAIRDYLRNRLIYMTREEIFMSVASTIPSNVASVSDAINMCERQMTRSIAKAFFDNETERKFASVRTFTELTNLMESNGVFIMPLFSPALDIVHIHRHDSAFESLIMNYYKHDDAEYREDARFSLVGTLSTIEGKCLAAMRRIEAGDNKTRSVLIVSDDDVSEIGKAFTKVAAQYGYVFFDTINAISNVSGKKVAVAVSNDYLRDTPRKYEVDAIIFMDILPIYLDALRAFNKAAAFGDDVKLVVPVMYDDFSEFLAEKFRKFSECDLIAENTDVTGNKYIETKKLLNCYRYFQEIVGHAKPLNEKFYDSLIALVAEFDKQSIFSSANTAFILSYLADCGPLLNKIYSESMSVKGDGENVNSGYNSAVRLNNSGDAQEEEKALSQQKKAFFNVCLKLLRRECTPPYLCTQCKEYDHYRINNFDDFTMAANGFFDKISTFADEYYIFTNKKAREKQISSDANINEQELNKLQALIAQEKETTVKCLNTLENAKYNKPGTFHVDYCYVNDVRMSAAKVYSTLFIKYYAICDRLLLCNGIRYASTAEQTAQHNISNR